MKYILALFAALPLRLHYFNARWIAFLVQYVIHYRTDVVAENLNHSFPEKSEKERKAIARDFYRHFARVAVEAIWFGGCHNPKRLIRANIVEVENSACLNELYQESPSVMVLYSHTGNWELLGGMCLYEFKDAVNPFTEHNCSFVYLRQSSEKWDKIMADNRIAPLSNPSEFDGYVESKNLVRYVVRNRNNKKLYNVNTDQRPYFRAPDFIWIDFMNRPARTMSGAAALANKFGMSVVYQRMMEKPGHGYEIEYVPICKDASKMEVEDIMKQYYRLLEDDLHAQPYNYLWTHKRWLD